MDQDQHLPEQRQVPGAVGAGLRSHHLSGPIGGYMPLFPLPEKCTNWTRFKPALNFEEPSAEIGI